LRHEKKDASDPGTLPFAGRVDSGFGRRERRIADGADADPAATSLKVSTRTVKADMTLNVHLVSGGGLAVIFTPRR